MEIKPLTFKKRIVEIREQYIDSDGTTKERIKTIEVPTGICEEDALKDSNDKKEN